MINSKNKLSEALEEAHQKCLEKLNGSSELISPQLFHYTDIEGGIAILDRQTIRFTDIRYLNDPRELDEGLEIYNKVSKKLLPTLLDQHPIYTRMMADLCHFLNSVLSFGEVVTGPRELREAVGASLIDFNNISYLNKPIYIACLSEHSDDLRQWLPYSNNGNGLSLGFKGVTNDGHYFFDTDTHGIKIVKASYENNQKKEEYVENLYNEALLVFNKTDFNQNGLMYLFITQCFTCFLYDMIACKSEKYKDEAEWRLIYTGEQEEPLFRIKDGIIRPYIDFNFSQNSLEKVTLGPNAEHDLNVHALNSLIARRGYINATIHKSDISYRG